MQPEKCNCEFCVVGVIFEDQNVIHEPWYDRVDHCDAHGGKVIVNQCAGVQ